MSTSHPETAIGSPRDRPASRTRRRLVLVAFVAIALVGSLALWRSTSLHGLPDIPDPLAGRLDPDRPLPDSLNAFTFYRRAYERHVDLATGSRAEVFTDPTQITPGLKAYLAANAEALDLWFRGTELDRAAYIVDPSREKGDILLDIPARLRKFGRLANLKAFLLQGEGKHAEAWKWLRANLRASRHAAMSGFMVERSIGNQIYLLASNQAFRWSDDPKVGVALLRQALADVEELNALPAPSDRTARYEAVVALNTLDDPAARGAILDGEGPRQDLWRRRIKPGLDAAHAALINEPERSRRVIKLILANWLMVSDLPAAERARRGKRFDERTFYDAAPGEAAAIAPDELFRWYQSTTYAKKLDFGWSRIPTVLAVEETRRYTLIVHLAEQLYLREHGRLPDRVEDLVGPYLKTVPTGYVAPDAAANTPGVSR
jgi:hypothetical protein